MICNISNRLFSTVRFGSIEHCIFSVFYRFRRQQKVKFVGRRINRQTCGKKATIKHTDMVEQICLSSMALMGMKEQFIKLNMMMMIIYMSCSLRFKVLYE